MSQDNVHCIGSILRHCPSPALHRAQQLKDGNSALELDVNGELALPPIRACQGHLKLQPVFLFAEAWYRRGSEESLATVVDREERSL